MYISFGAFQHAPFSHSLSPTQIRDSNERFVAKAGVEKGPPEPSPPPPATPAWRGLRARPSAARVRGLPRDALPDPAAQPADQDAHVPHMPTKRALLQNALFLKQKF